MKVLITATVQSHIAQFHLPLIDLLKEHGYEVHVAAKDNLVEKNGLKLETPDKIFNIPFERSPLNIKNLLAFKQLKSIISNNNYDVIHCNTPMGGAITRLVAKGAHKKGTKVYYTAHGFHFYSGSPLRNWILYYPIEKWLSKYTDKIITISNEDYVLANRKKFKAKVERIHGVGADSERYSLPTDKLITLLREEFGYKKENFICICTGELNRNKNQAVIIEAVPKIIRSIPHFRLLLAGNGPQRSNLQDLIDDKSLNNYVELIGYQTKLERYVKLADIAVSASIREGLGLNLVEAMLCGKPVVGSKNRGHNELISHLGNGVLVNPHSSEEFAEAIIKLYKQKDLYNEMKKNALEISKEYTKESVIREFKKIYEL